MPPDRELHHINPKGRPVKQCDHCRSARKSKSHHAKCGCGEKKDKAKDKVDVKGEFACRACTCSLADSCDKENSCCCHSGAKCSCGLKKEALELKVDTGKQTLHGMRSRPQATASHSESNLTVFANGHHKPCHRNNNSAHISGVPYKIPRPHTLHGASAFAAYTQGSTHASTEPSAQRSLDTLSLSNNDFYAMFGSNTYPTHGLPLTDSSIQEPLFATSNSAFPQGSQSPESPLSDTMAGTQWPWASSVTPANGTFGYASLSGSPSHDGLPGLEHDWSIPSAGLANPTWSAHDLPLDSKLGEDVVQSLSHSGESHHSAPGLTASSSPPSDMGETPLFGDVDFRAPQSNPSESLFWEDTPAYRLSAPTSVETRAPTSTPQASEAQRLSLDFSKGLSPVLSTMTSHDLYGETQAIAMPNTMDDLTTTTDPWNLDQANTAFGAYDTFRATSYPQW